MDFDKVVAGILKYLDKEIYANMNDWQEILARVAVARMVSQEDVLKRQIMENPFLRTYAIVRSDGKIDVDGLAADLKKQIAAKGKITISLPMLGSFTFVEQDVDTLYQAIVG